MSLLKEQIDIEQASEGRSSAKYIKDLTDAIAQGRFDDTKEGQALMKVMFLPIRDKVTEYFGTKYRGLTEKTQNLIKLISDDPNEVTYIIISELVKTVSMSNNSVSLTTLAINITKSLKKLHYFSRLKKDNPKLHAYLGQEYRRASARRKEQLITSHIKDMYEIEEGDGDKINNTKVGIQLIELVLLSNTNIIEKRSMKGKGKKNSSYFISFTQEAINTLFNLDTIFPTLVLNPMIVPPNDWVSNTDGGYLHCKVNLVKSPHPKHRRFMNKEADLSKVIPQINKLQKTGWRINKRVSGVIYDVYYNNMIDPKSPKELPRCYGDIPSPNVRTVEEIVGYTVEWQDDPTPEHKERWRIWNKAKEKIRIGLDGEVGRRLQFVLTLKMVDDMIDYAQFYYVYQMDYRQRVYPHTDFLTPQSKGYTKAMLEFAEGRLLDDRGLRWLKIHTANCWGLDKAPFDDRVKWAEDNRDKLLEVAKDPMETLKYWTEADSPYEFLAACYAYQDHIEGKEVHLPIQLDAVNSGVQFYSGLLLDAEGARNCCVIGKERSDLYKLVADKVNKMLEDKEYPKILSFFDSEDKERSVGTREEAESLKGKVTRSMTKKNVMTVPYSVTMRGMKEQNWDTMDDMELLGKDFWKGDPWVVNYLLTELNYKAIFELINGARQGQDYLKEVAKTLDEPAIWYTPIYKFPVLQPAYKRKSVRVITPLGRLSISIGTDELNRAKQLSGVAANYIHSIDSTLLLWCVEHMSTNLGVIHDCFLVHPNNGDEIRDHYKRGYIEIMKGRPLEQFSNQLDPEGKVKVPCIGTLNLDDVMDSEYIIS